MVHVSVYNLLVDLFSLVFKIGVIHGIHLVHLSHHHLLLFILLVNQVDIHLVRILKIDFMTDTAESTSSGKTLVLSSELILVHHLLLGHLLL